MATDYVQTRYRIDNPNATPPELSRDQFVAGQIANTIPSVCESGRLADPPSGAPANLGYGLACRRTGYKVVQIGAGRRKIGTLGAAFNSNTMTLNLLPGLPHPAIGSTIIIGSENDIRITAVGTNGTYTTSGRSSTHASGDDVFIVEGGPTDFAGVAVRQTALSAHNDPIDSYKTSDLVEIGSKGDFVVQTSGTVAMGDRACVDMRTANAYANYAKFSSASENATDYIGIPGAVFMTDVTASAGGIAILRLTIQAA